MNSELKTVSIYTYNFCRPDPGPGGFGAILSFGKHRKEILGGFASTTGNRMEIHAANAALSCLKYPCAVELHSESDYLVEHQGDGSIALFHSVIDKEQINISLWERLAGFCRIHHVKFIVTNERNSEKNIYHRCKELAEEGWLQPDLPDDLPSKSPLEQICRTCGNVILYNNTCYVCRRYEWENNGRTLTPRYATNNHP